ncbi:hypothetical protein DXT99_05770 [Pontibacter diazotrophicus]|uniref:Uncharacterized protein n=1 Tax=Pontibacter diazotrophicus TaxID=1400979 RepID=A0A3D8LFH8_9BACT|nr:hypothetical protein DXT99_05770 [Pontibacter diazotrophicus]
MLQQSGWSRTWSSIFLLVQQEQCLNFILVQQCYHPALLNPGVRSLKKRGSIDKTFAILTDKA